jgi:hypothetical protein
MKNPAAGAFRALSIFNFRVWSAGALVSNIGTWMQRVAQDWLANRFGPRWALGVGASSGFAAALVTIYVLTRYVLTRRTGLNHADLAR